MQGDNSAVVFTEALFSSDEKGRAMMRGTASPVFFANLAGAEVLAHQLEFERPATVELRDICILCRQRKAGKPIKIQPVRTRVGQFDATGEHARSWIKYQLHKQCSSQSLIIENETYLRAIRLAACKAEIRDGVIAAPVCLYCGMSGEAAPCLGNQAGCFAKVEEAMRDGTFRGAAEFLKVDFIGQARSPMKDFREPFLPELKHHCIVGAV